MRNLLLPWLLLCASAVASEVHNITRRETGSGGGRRVVCYYTNWSVYRPGTAKFSPQNINPYLCTHLIYAFGGLTRDNSLRPYDKYQDIEQGGYAKFTGLKTYNKNLKTLLAIGGWNEGSARFSPLVADEERRAEFVHNVVRFLRQNHFDGLDLDWEYPAFRDGGKARDRANYALLVQELRAEFDRESSKTGRPRLLLTMAVPAGIEYIDKGYDIPKLNRYLDFMNILSYDYHSAFEPAVNHHAPLYPLEEDSEYNFDAQLSIDYTIGHYMKLGADREKLVLGIPTYGRSYTLFNPLATEMGSPADGPGEQGDATREKGYLAYYEICENIKSSEDWKVLQPNPTAMGPYAYKGNQWVGFDDIDIVKLKARYVSENGLGGIMFWAIDNDDFRGKCHGRAYPLIEAGKEALLATSGTSNEVVSVAPSSGSGKGKRPGKRGPSNSGGRQTSSQGRKRRPSRLKTTSTTTTTTTTTTTPKYDYGLTTPEPPTTPDPGSDFMCKDEGFFPHPRDCKKYFWCLDSGPSNLGIVAHQFTCPSGLFFNKAADSCDYARNVVCKKKPSSGGGTTTKAPPITAATSRTTRLSTTSTTTTTTTTTPEPEPEEEEYDEEYEDEEEAEEDPQVIKELINLIKKLGGVEQLEKQLHLQETGRAGGDTSSTAGISKSLYERVLSSRNKERVSTTPKYTSLFRNRPVGPQNAGLDSLEEVQAVRREKPKYVTISRNRPSTPTPEEQLDDDEELLDEDELEDDDAPGPVEDAQDQHAKLPEYVTIRRQRPSTTTEEVTTPKYVTIQRSRPKTSTEPPEPVEEEITTTTTTQRPRPVYFSTSSTPKLHLVTPSRPTRAPPKVQEDVEEEEEATTEQVSQRYRPGTEETPLISGNRPAYVDVSTIGRRRGTTSPAPEYELEENLVVTTESPTEAYSKYKNVDVLTRRRGSTLPTYPTTESSVSPVEQEPTTPLPTEPVITTPSTTRFTPTVTRVITSVTESGTTERQRIAVNRVPYLAIAAARGETVYPGPLFISATTPIIRPGILPSTEKVMEINRITLVTAEEDITERMTTRLDVVQVGMDKVSEVNRMKQVTVFNGVANTTEQSITPTEPPVDTKERTNLLEQQLRTTLQKNTTIETDNEIETTGFYQPQETTELTNYLEHLNDTDSQKEPEDIATLTDEAERDISYRRWPTTTPDPYARRRPNPVIITTTKAPPAVRNYTSFAVKNQQNGIRRRPFRGPARSTSETPAEGFDTTPKPGNGTSGEEKENVTRGTRRKYRPFRSSTSETPAETPRTFSAKRRGSYRRRSSTTPASSPSSTEEVTPDITDVRDIDELLTALPNSTEAGSGFVPKFRRKNVSSSDISLSETKQISTSTENIVISDSKEIDKEVMPAFETTTVMKDFKTEIENPEKPKIPLENETTSSVTSSTALNYQTASLEEVTLSVTTSNTTEKYQTIPIVEATGRDHTEPSFETAYPAINTTTEEYKSEPLVEVTSPSTFSSTKNYRNTPLVRNFRPTTSTTTEKLQTEASSEATSPLTRSRKRQKYRFTPPVRTSLPTTNSTGEEFQTEPLIAVTTPVTRGRTRQRYRTTSLIRNSLPASSPATEELQTEPVLEEVTSPLSISRSRQKYRTTPLIQNSLLSTISATEELETEPVIEVTSPLTISRSRQKYRTTPVIQNPSPTTISSTEELETESVVETEITSPLTISRTRQKYQTTPVIQTSLQTNSTTEEPQTDTLIEVTSPLTISRTRQKYQTTPVIQTSLQTNSTTEEPQTDTLIEVTSPLTISSTRQRNRTTPLVQTSSLSTSSTATPSTSPRSRRRLIKKRRRRPTTPDANQEAADKENEVSLALDEHDNLGVTPFVTAALLEREDSTVRSDNQIIDARNEPYLPSSLEEQELTKAEESGYDRNFLHLSVESPSQKVSHEKDHMSATVVFLGGSSKGSVVASSSSDTEDPFDITSVDVATTEVSGTAESSTQRSPSSRRRRPLKEDVGEVTTTNPITTTARSPLRRPSSVTLYNRARQRGTTSVTSTTTSTTEAPSSSTAGRRRRPGTTRVIRRRKYNNGTRSGQDSDATASQVQTLDSNTSDAPSSGRVRKFSFPKRRTSTTPSATTIGTTAPPPPPPPPPPIDDRELLVSNEQQISEREDLPDLADPAVVAIHNLATAPAITSFSSTLRPEPVEYTGSTVEQPVLISSTGTPFVVSSTEGPSEAVTRIRLPSSTARLISTTSPPRRSNDGPRRLPSPPRAPRPFSRISTSASTTSRPRPRPQPVAPVVDYDYYDDIDSGADAVVAGILPASAGKVKIHSDGYIECLDRGNFPHPFSCKKFISCAKMENGELLGWEYTCPRQLSFDPIGGICNWSAGLGCKE